MAIIQEYLATQQVEVSRIPRASQNIVAAGQGIVAQQIVQTAGQIGQGVIDIATVQAQKQQARNGVTLAEMKGALADYEFNTQPDPDAVNVIEDFQRQEDRFMKGWDKMTQRLPHGKSQVVTDEFKFYTVQQRVNAKKAFANKRRPMEKSWAIADLKKQWATRLKGNVGNTDLAKKELNDLVDAYRPYLTTTEEQAYRADVDRSVEAFHIQVAIDGDPESAFDLIDSAKTLDEGEKNTLRSQVRSSIARNEREEKVRLQEARHDTMRTLLANYWDGNLTDPNIVTQFMKAGYLDVTDAKFLHEAMLNPDPPKTKLTAEAAVRQAIEDIGTNIGTKEGAMSVLYQNVQNIDPVKGSSLLNSIFAAHDKNIAEIQKESRITMEELIRDKDKLSGLFTDDERQILANSEAYLMLDEDIRKAAQEGKPLSRRDTLIRATEIGRQMKKKLKAEEEANIEPSFSPDEPTDADLIATLSPERQAVYRDANQATRDKMLANLKRAEIGKSAISLKTGRPIPKRTKKLPVPAFTMEGKEPEIVFDSGGKELGLKLKRGGIWRIGESGYISGSLYEYTGNGNWKAVK